jgi:hypothetical protein
LPPLEDSPKPERLSRWPISITDVIFHATGKRIRSLPVTPDKLL